MKMERIREIVEKYAFPKFKITQLADGIFRKYVSNFDEITTLSLTERKLLNENEQILSLEPYKVFVSAEGNAFKALLKLKSTGRLIETVLLNPKPGLWSTCISSQVGCAMGCTFCATGTMGLLQNLTAEEISDQVLFWKQYIRVNDVKERMQFLNVIKSGNPANLSNVVFMGMGEPMANMDAVCEAIRELTDERGLNMASRNVSVSTSGLVPGIIRLGEEFPQVNLALSLHSANDSLRSKLMPVANKAYSLAKLKEALKAYFELTNRKVFIEYILLDKENDRDEDARALVDFVRSLEAPHLLHVNLIVYNKTDSGHEESSRGQAMRFKDFLLKHGVSATIRKNLGRDIMAACGQLVVKQGEPR